MYLEKLEIQGFKSFANKNVLIFPGKVDGRAGVTSIVGPNGSGKSNIADAVRWALGEQSMKTLRGKKSEDIIFSGSDKKSKLGMAEVSLFLNNEDHKAPLEYDQIIITRRLFRDGESEYLLNGNRVRLLDIQMLLAKANFGQKTYSVIGQGMVENFLNTSLAERKEFFDEATGVKQYQIKREDSLNKLKLSLENLSQSQMLLAEIEPRLKVLTRQVARFEKKEELQIEFNDLALNYYGRLWQDLNKKLDETNTVFLEADSAKRDKVKKLQALEKELSTLERQNSGSADFSAWQKRLGDLQREKDALTGQIAKLDAWLEVQLEGQGKFDLSFLNNKQRELTEDKNKLESETKSLAAEIVSEQKKFTALEQDKKDLTDKLIKLNQELSALGHKAPASEAAIKEKLTALIAKLEAAEVHQDLNEVRKILAQIKHELKDLVGDSLAESGQTLLEFQAEISETTAKRELLFEDFNEVKLNLKTKEERQKLLAGRLRQISDELDSINKKLKQQQTQVGSADKQKERQALEEKLTEINVQLAEAGEQFSSLQQTQEAKRADIFLLQKNLQLLQAEVNQLDNQLNQGKVEAVRHETRLEDLEKEIRENELDLSALKTFKASGDLALDEAYERIKQLKRQLESIGSIDAEVEKEYAETKTRFEFISTQVNDLTATIESLEEIIAELDTIIKARFDEEFKIIENKFGEYFKILFNGGSAKIIKVMAEEMDQTDGESGEAQELSFKDKVMKKLKALSRHDSVGLAGVDIVATPPGKKIQTVTMLSGGERALTAIALICAIISANPSPFVVLDEVDAALDEANSERLAKILDDLSHKTQFIAITHNRAMMRRATVLYGITMGDDSVSKLLSVKLEEIPQTNK